MIWNTSGYNLLFLCSPDLRPLILWESVGPGGNFAEDLPNSFLQSLGVERDYITTHLPPGNTARSGH